MISKTLGQPLIAGALVCLATSVSLMAQTPTYTTSSAYEPELNSLLLEAPVAYNASAAYALPAIVVTEIQAGAAQLRVRIDTYDPVGRTYVGTLFICATSEPSPAPAADLSNGNVTVISQSTQRVESIYHYPSLAAGLPESIGLVGRFLYPTAIGSTASATVPPGTPFMLTFSYPPDAIGSVGDQNASFEEVSFLVPGNLNLYSSTGVGAIIVTPAPVAQPPAANKAAAGKKVN